MKFKIRIIIIVLVLLFIISGIFIGMRFLYPKEITNGKISGMYLGNQVWRGGISITGDTEILGDLEILPGTIIRFAVQDDQNGGDETPADGYNDNDPTRLLDYSKTHSELVVIGKLVAVGTPEKRILFTSASEIPKIADWVGITPYGDGARIEYSIIEWSRHGIGLGDKATPNSVFRNNIIMQTMWGGLSLGKSSAKAYNNEIYECGHEGIDVQGGNPVIMGNYIHDCHAGIVVLSGSPVIKNNIIKNVGDGIAVLEGSAPQIENNTVELAAPENVKEWRYGNFAYTMFDK